jgi:hypothetical protein
MKKENKNESKKEGRCKINWERVEKNERGRIND